MNILLVSATSQELLPLVNCFSKIEEGKYGYGSLKIESLITGVGMVATAFQMGKKMLDSKFDLAINIGLAGAFDRSLELGEVVVVHKDRFSEEGAEDGEHFLSMDSLGLRGANDFPFEDGWINDAKEQAQKEELALRRVRGITVNTVHGEETSIARVEQLFAPQIETMEGASFLYACRMNHVPCLQLRAISNYVEKRNRAAWKMDLALKALRDRTLIILTQLERK